MAKKCLYCGQPLREDDARFCNGCGRSQNPFPARSASAPAPIRVKLPPKEFSRFGSSVSQEEDSLPVWPPEGARVPQRTPSTGQPSRSPQRTPPAGRSSRLAKRPVRLTPQELAVQVEQPEKEDAPAPASPPDTSSPQAGPAETTPVEEISTMVLPGWREELERLRKMRSAALPEKETQEPDAPAQSKVDVPQQPQGALLSSQETASSRGSIEQGELPAPGQSSRPPEDTAGPTEPLQRELRVKIWEQEPTVHSPQIHIHAEKPEPGPDPAVEHVPFADLLPGPDEDEQIEQLADIATIHWQTMPDPAPAQEEDQDLTKLEEESEQAEEAGSKALEEPRTDEQTRGVEDLPTVPLAVPRPEKRKPQVTIERASTPAPKNWGGAKKEEIEDLPTRPVEAALGPARPLSPLPPAPRQTSQAQGAGRPESRLGPASNVPNQPLQPGPHSPAFAGQPVNAALSAQHVGAPPAPSGRSANPPSQPGPPFNPPSMPSPPRNPASLPGNTMSRPAGQGVQSPEVAEPFARRPSPFASMTPLPTTPRPDLAAVDAALAQSNQPGKHVSRRMVFVLILLLVAGGAGGFVLYYQLSSAPSITRPMQAYQNSAFGISLSYPQHWSVHVDQAHNTLSFADSTSTGQITLSMASATGQLSQYLTRETSQLGITGPKAMPAATFAGSSWQQEQGTVTQGGATYTITLYVTQHNNHFYALAFLAPSPAYAQMDQDDFAPLRASFSFQ